MPDWLGRSLSIVALFVPVLAGVFIEIYLLVGASWWVHVIIWAVVVLIYIAVAFLYAGTAEDTDIRVTSTTSIGGDRRRLREDRRRHKEEIKQLRQEQRERSAKGRVRLGERERHREGRPQPSDRDVQFTVYRPSAVRPLKMYPLHVFAHKAGTYVDAEGKTVNPKEQVQLQAQSLLGSAHDFYGNVTADSGRPVTRGSRLTFMPWIESAHVEPESISVRWGEHLRRASFEFQVSGHAIGRSIQGIVQVLDDITLICEVPFTVAVTLDAEVIGLPVAATASCYRKIFASYSHDDKAIVRSVVSRIETLGDRYSIDVRDLRAGEVWNDRLAELIREADIFQLFWSRNSMRSPFVRREWEYALHLKRDRFVRPLHWERPIPEDKELGLPPASLRTLHFALLPRDTIDALMQQANAIGQDRFGEVVTVPAADSSHSSHAGIRRARIRRLAFVLMAIILGASLGVLLGLLLFFR